MLSQVQIFYCKACLTGVNLKLLCTSHAVDAWSLLIIHDDGLTAIPLCTATAVGELSFPFYQFQSFGSGMVA